MLRTNSSILSCADSARTAARVAVAAAAGLSLLAVGCGYRLGGGDGLAGASVPASLSRLSLEGMKRYAPLRQALKSALHAQGVRVVARAQAGARLMVAGEEIAQRSLVIADSARTREYLLTAVVEFSVRGEGGVLLAKQRVQSEGSYLYDAQRPLISESARDRALQHLRRDLAHRIVGRLAAIGADG